MDDLLCRRFFDEPSCPAQRQYEALGAVFIEGLSQKEAAGRFGYTADAFRQLVHQFRLARAADTTPPFSSPRDADARPARPRVRRGRPTRRTPPTPASST
jgi:transposase